MLAAAVRTGVPPKEADQAILRCYEEHAPGSERRLPRHDRTLLYLLQDTHEGDGRKPPTLDARQGAWTCEIWTNIYEPTFTTSDFGTCLRFNVPLECTRCVWGNNYET